MKTYLEKKLEKRAKQRENNLIRAKEMHEMRISGKIPSAKIKNLKTKKIYIGCSGWFYWDWKEKFYPKEIATNKWFDYYSDNFKTVELNAPFYSWPTISTVKTWVRQIKNKDFVYTVKVSELITHVKKFKRTKILVKDFYLIADIIKDHMGCFLFQLPPSFKYSKSALKSIISQLDNKYKNVVEFRHKSWWREDVYEAFKEAGIIFCSTSGPKLPDDLIKTADDIYIRFHGVERWYRYLYSEEELKNWAEKIKKSKAKNIWIYFNNDFDTNAIKNSKQLAKYLEVKS